MRPSALVIAVSLATTVVAQGPPPPRRLPPPGSFSTSSATQPISPVAVATWVARVDSKGTYLLDLLVVWRGSPGWFAKSPRSSSGGGSAKGYSETLSYGDVQLELFLSSAPRELWIQRQPVPLGSDNVVLVDGADSAAGPVVVRSLSVDPSMPGSGGLPRIEDVLRRSPEILDFLRCGTSVPDSRLQPTIDILCARLAVN